MFKVALGHKKVGSIETVESAQLQQVAFQLCSVQFAKIYTLSLLSY